jgi:hypothetical protein
MSSGGDLIPCLHSDAGAKFLLRDRGGRHNSARAHRNERQCGCNGASSYEFGDHHGKRSPSGPWLGVPQIHSDISSQVPGSRSVPHSSLCYFCKMDKRITRYNSLKAMKADEYRSWQRLPGSERIRAVMDLNLELYALKGQGADAPRLQRTIVRFQRRTG